MSLSEIVESLGYIFEEHNVITSDGYILKIHRVYKNISIKIQEEMAKSGQVRPVVLL